MSVVLYLLQDMSSKTQFTILTDRSHGGGSLKDGSLELMVYYICVYACHTLCSLKILITGYISMLCSQPLCVVMCVYICHATCSLLCLCVSLVMSL